MKFKKRTLKNPKEFFGEVWFVTRNMKRLKDAKAKGLISTSFRERLMLAVTAVNDCRYCSYFHSKQAVKSGLTPEEISQLLSGDIASCPEREAIALIYAQHWAEADAYPDPEAVQKVQKTYGDEMTKAIHMTLRVIRLGNLMGNSLDYLLYRLSFGKLRG
jgi:AhpD family alkylhydroperoxidase